LREKLSAACQENPAPSLQQIAKRLGYKYPSTLHARCPDLYHALIESRRVYLKERNESFKRRLTAVLTEGPPPSLRTIAARLGHKSESRVSYQFPELAKAIADTFAQPVSFLFTDILPAVTDKPATALGLATITVTGGDGRQSTGVRQIKVVAPGLFSFEASGGGLAAAVALRIRPDGSQSFEPVARFDAAQNRFVAAPIDLGPETDQVFLLLFGAGLRGRGSLTGVTAMIGGVNSVVEYIGPQGDFAGLDQMNLRLPRQLAGRGVVEISLSADGLLANSVQVSIR
jgi:uncharacterized protein (TIGR03437 family)